MVERVFGRGLGFGGVEFWGLVEVLLSRVLFDPIRFGAAESEFCRVG